jgi:hypothetical protein
MPCCAVLGAGGASSEVVPGGTPESAHGVMMDD